MSNSKSEEAQAILSTSCISASLLQIRQKLQESEAALKQIDQVSERSKVLQDLKPCPLDIDDLVALDRAHQHLSWLDVISKVLEKSKNAKKEPETLIQCHRVLVAFVSALIESKCLNLRTFALDSLFYLRSSHIPALEAELEADLEALNYPKCVLGLDDEDIVKNQDLSNVKKFQKNYAILQELQLPSVILKRFELSNTGIIF